MQNRHHKTDKAALVPLVFRKGHLPFIFYIENEGVTALPLPLADSALPKRITKRIPAANRHIFPRHLVSLENILGRSLRCLGLIFFINFALNFVLSGTGFRFTLHRLIFIFLRISLFNYFCRLFLLIFLFFIIVLSLIFCTLAAFGRHHIL